MVAARIKIGAGLFHIHRANAQRIDQSCDCRRIALVGRHNVGIRPIRVMQRSLTDLIKVVQVALAEDSRAVRNGKECVNLIIDNIAETPLAALPGIGKIPTGNFGIVPDAARQPVKRNVDRRSNIRACRFGQDAQSVMVGDVISERRPEVIDAVRQHTRFSR